MALPRRTARTPLLLIVAVAITVGLADCGAIPEEATAPQPAMTSAPTTAPEMPSGGPSRSTGPVASAESERPKKASTAPTDRTTQRSPQRHAQTVGTKLIFRVGDHSAAVRELQARLAQLAWYQGRITEHYGAETMAAVKGFQEKRRLPVTGAVDRTTWSRLIGMTHQPSHDQLHNIAHAGPPIMDRGDQSQQVRQLQARLKQLDWFAENVTGFYGPATAEAVRGFQDKHGFPATGAVDHATWSGLVSMTREPSRDELAGNSSGTGAVPVADLDQRCLTGRAICIDKTTRRLVWVVDGKPGLGFDVRFGADATPTREGSFTVGWKARDWTSTLYHSEMPYAMFFSGGQAVHYSSDFAARGYYGASHGCVNVRDLAGVESLFSQARVGDKVIVYRS